MAPVDCKTALTSPNPLPGIACAALPVCVGNIGFGAGFSKLLSENKGVVFVTDDSMSAVIGTVVIFALVLPSARL